MYRAAGQPRYSQPAQLEAVAPAAGAGFLSPEELEPEEPEPDELEESEDLDPLPELPAALSELDEELSEDELSLPLEPDPLAAPAGTVLAPPLRLSVR
jgi:hypothetical protein